jgi:hypothetical protein
VWRNEDETAAEIFRNRNMGMEYSRSTPFRVNCISTDLGGQLAFFFFFFFLACLLYLPPRGPGPISGSGSVKKKPFNTPYYGIVYGYSVLPILHIRAGEHLLARRRWQETNSYPRRFPIAKNIYRMHDGCSSSSRGVSYGQN